MTLVAEYGMSLCLYSFLESENSNEVSVFIQYTLLSKLKYSSAVHTHSITVVTSPFSSAPLNCRKVMHPPSSFGRGAVVALGLVSSVFAAPGLKACLPDDGIEVVQLQPVEVICDGKTLTTTFTR